jgi:hypothetical protein
MASYRSSAENTLYIVQIYRLVTFQLPPDPFRICHRHFKYTLLKQNSCFYPPHQACSSFSVLQLNSHSSANISTLHVVTNAKNSSSIFYSFLPSSFTSHNLLLQQMFLRLLPSPGILPLKESDTCVSLSITILLSYSKCYLLP